MPNPGPISDAEKRVIRTTLATYHPQTGAVEIWHHYPAGFSAGYYGEKESTVYLTDPHGTVPADIVYEEQLRYFAREDRLLATVSLRDVVSMFIFLKHVPPAGLLIMRGFIPREEVPSKMPDPARLPPGWSLHQGSAPGQYPLFVPRESIG